MFIFNDGQGDVTLVLVPR